MNNHLWIDYIKLRSNLDFATVLNFYQIKFPANQLQVKIKCPFHDDQTPSCGVHLERKMFRCFGCSEQGNSLEFVTKMEKQDPGDKDGLRTGALKAIAILGHTSADYQKGSAKTPATPRIDEKGSNGRNTLIEDENGTHSVSDEVVFKTPNPVLDLVLSLDPKHPFLASRGISPDVAKEFGLGFCNRGMMKNRIAIPIHNLAGELVAYSGRWVDEDLPEKVQRYKLPKKFLKSLELYNLHRAKNLHQRHLVLVEGFWSTIRLHQAGIACASLFGNSCSYEQAELVEKAGFRFVTLLLDGDEAGRLAIAENLKILAEHVYVRVLNLPDGVKPDTMAESWFDRLKK